MLLVTLHGGKPENNPHKNNVHAYDKDGKKITSSLLESRDDLTLNELRGLCLVGKYLYVVNANMQQNSVLCYEGSGASYKYVSTFASSETCKGILHPFDLVFDGLDYCYLSSQDTNVVTRLIVAKDGTTGNAAPLSRNLPTSGIFLPGTFVASSKGDLPPQATTPVKPPHGLSYYNPKFSTDKKHSVRGLAWANGHLYVVDQPAGTVKIYNISGEFVGQSNVLETPVHVLAHQGKLYVSGANQVSSSPIPSPAGDFILSPIKKLKVKNSSGMAFNSSGHFYVASRTENTILGFDNDFRPTKFHCDLPDNPEFLLHL